MPGLPRLYIYYAGNRFLVHKDRFVIGRGKSACDLVIKDPNVSRQHALVEFAGGRFCMVDIGSTNGILFRGRRVPRRAICDGDRYFICNHELAFAYG